MGQLNREQKVEAGNMKRFTVTEEGNTDIIAEGVQYSDGTWDMNIFEEGKRTGNARALQIFGELCPIVGFSLNWKDEN